MRARIINEVNFERGSDPKSSMLIGKAKKANDLLEEIYKKDKFFIYHMKNPDHIEISYSDYYKKILSGDSNVNNHWVIRLVEKDRFFITENFKNTGSEWSEKRIQEIEIFETSARLNPDPNEMGFKLTFIVSLRKGPDSKEKMDIILKGFNEFYGDKIYGFELAEKIDGRNT